MIRYEIRGAEGATFRYEIERLESGAAWTRVYDGDGVLLEDRAATDREEANLVRQEQAEYRTGLRTSATQALDILQAQRAERQTILDNDATTILQVNQALDMIVNHLNTMHVVTGHLIRLAVRQQGKE